MARDKQLGNICLDAVIEKRRLDQALNAKEFAVLAGISYSTARSWFKTPGFPAFSGVVFWQDFVRWRTARSGVETSQGRSDIQPVGEAPMGSISIGLNLPPRAMQLLREARKNS